MGFEEKFGLKEETLRTAHFDTNEGLPPVFVDKTSKEQFYGSYDGMDLKSYKIGSWFKCDKEKLMNYVKDMAPNLKVQKVQDYYQVRDKNSQDKTICEMDHQNHHIHCLGWPFKMAPILAYDVYEMIKDWVWVQQGSWIQFPRLMNF